MSDLESKAKTQLEITEEHCNWSCRHDRKKFPKPNLEQKWVRLEDAQELQREIQSITVLWKADRKIRDDCLLANQELLARLERIRKLEFRAFKGLKHCTAKLLELDGIDCVLEDKFTKDYFLVLGVDTKQSKECVKVCLQCLWGGFLRLRKEVDAP